MKINTLTFHCADLFQGWILVWAMHSTPCCLKAVLIILFGKRLHHSVKSASTLVFNIRKYHELKKWNNFFWKFLVIATYPKIVGPVGILYQSSKVSYVLPPFVRCLITLIHILYIYIHYTYIYIYIYICISTTVNYWSLITSPPLWPGFCLEIQTSGDVHSSTAPWPSSWPAIITKQFCGCEGLQEPRASYTPIHFPTTIKATTKGRNERTRLIPSHSTSRFLHTRNFRSKAGKNHGSIQDMPTLTITIISTKTHWTPKVRTLDCKRGLLYAPPSAWDPLG